MFSKSKFNSCFFLLLMATYMSFGQYLNKLHDYDTSSDWGTNIFLKNDGTYLVFGNSFSSYSKWNLINMKLSSDGDIVLSQGHVANDSANLHEGAPGYGEVKKTPTGRYVEPFTVQYVSSTGPMRSAAGLVMYDANGDTLFTRLYTDTSLYFDGMVTCDVMPDSGFIIGGFRGINAPSYFPSYLVRTDSVGDTIWTRKYQKYTGQEAMIKSVIGLADGRIAIGARSRYNVVTPSLDVYYHYSPWFLLLDAGGNVIRDTVYGSTYGGEGKLYKDSIGGYVHTGYIDTLAVPADVVDYHNFPCYISHIDTNFRMSWITRFPYTDDGRRSPFGVTQLHSGNYLVYGVSNRWPKSFAWAAKINRSNGDIIWNNYYVSDSFNAAYLTDVVEKDDGSLVFIGATFNNSLPAWHQGRDVWLLGTDSNGCPSPLCFTDTSTTATHVVQQPVDFTLFPNPTNGGFTINAPYPGNITVCDLQGRVVLSATLRKGNNDLNLPPGLSAGMYLCRYVCDKGENTVVKLSYQP